MAGAQTSILPSVSAFTRLKLRLPPSPLGPPSLRSASFPYGNRGDYCQTLIVPAGRSDLSSVPHSDPRTASFSGCAEFHDSNSSSYSIPPRLFLQIGRGALAVSPIYDGLYIGTIRCSRDACFHSPQLPFLPSTFLTSVHHLSLPSAGRRSIPTYISPHSLTVTLVRVRVHHRLMCLPS